MQAKNRLKAAVPGNIKTLVKRSLNLAGYELVHINSVPMLTLMGLRTKDFDILIDIGANRGEFFDYFAGFNPAATGYLYEPLHEEYTKLIHKYGRNKYVHIFHTAIGNRNGHATIHHDIDHSPSSSILASTPRNANLFPITTRTVSESIELRRLDDAFPNHETKNKSIFVKIDVQGYEHHVLDGGQATLMSADVILMEINLAHLYEGQSGFYELNERMCRLGFHYAGNFNQVYDSAGHCLYLDALYSRTSV